MADPYFLGVEIGGTKLQVGLGHGDGRLLFLDRQHVVPAKGASGIRKQVTQSVESLLKTSSLPIEQISAIGIGFGGPIDVRTGIVRTSHQIDGWSDFPLVDWVRNQLGIGCVALENDADAAGLGEARFGAGAGESPVLYVTVGSGIGGGLILDGSIYRGMGLGATEIGHLCVGDLSREQDIPTTIEQVASGWAIAEAASLCVEKEFRHGWPTTLLMELSGGDPSRLSAATVAEAARRGDPDACRILIDATRALATGLAHAITLLGPRRIILGGGVSMIGEEQWFEPIRREVQRRVFSEFVGTYDIVPAALGEAVVVHGALAAARDAWRGQSRFLGVGQSSPDR